MKTSGLDYASFLIRLWREPEDKAPSSDASCDWLAQVEHILSGEKRYFTSLEDLFAFIRLRLPGAQEEPP
jgi:hypothetical protein